MTFIEWFKSTYSSGFEIVENSVVSSSTVVDYYESDYIDDEYIASGTFSSGDQTGNYYYKFKNEGVTLNSKIQEGNHYVIEGNAWI